MEKKCLIISGGDFHKKPEAEDYALVIACDRGYTYAKEWGIRPDLIIGDFDSAPLPETEVPVLRYPSEKDDTDTMLAVREALRRGFSRIDIGCALGGRLDHAVANMQAAGYIAEQGASARLMGEGEEVLALPPGSWRLPARKGWSLSVFSLTERCRGVDISGTKYQVKGAEISSRFPIGASNVWTEKEAEIRLREGILLVVMSRLKKNEHI